MGGPDGRFPETAWSVIAPPDADPHRRHAALDKLIRRYWRPVYCYIRRVCGRDPENSKELTQEFFSAILEGRFLDQFSAQRGSFRSFLKTSVSNFVCDDYRATHRAKRGAGRVFPIDVDAEAIPDPAWKAEDVFDREFRKAVLDRAVEIVGERLTDAGLPGAFEVFKRYDLAPDDRPASYKTVADELGMTIHAVKNHLDRARDTFRRAVIEATAEITGSEDDLTDEINRLFLS